MSQIDNLRLIWLEQRGIIVRGHRVLSDNRHAENLFDDREFLNEPTAAGWLCGVVASYFANKAVETVVGLPTETTIVVRNRIAEHLVYLRRIAVQTADEKTSRLGRLPNFPVGDDKGGTIPPAKLQKDWVRGRNCLLVSDRLTTENQSQIQEIINGIRRRGGTIVGIGAVVNCANVVPKNFRPEVPVFAAINLPVAIWPADKCPHCRKT